MTVEVITQGVIAGIGLGLVVDVLGRYMGLSFVDKVLLLAGLALIIGLFVN